MLTGVVRDGVLEMLTLMTDQDVISLAQTLTNHFIELATIDDAVRAICSYGANALDVLRRKKVKKETLFRYLDSKNAKVNPQFDKSQVINAVLQFWKCTEVQTSVVEEDMHEEEISVESSAVPDGTLQQMGETFVQWFYQLLNAAAGFQNPNVADKFGPHHFWHDCRCRMDLKSPSNSHEFNCGTGIDTANCLMDLTATYGLLFNPNATKEGVQISSDPHGFIKILVSGAIHTRLTCIGMFKQVFGLVKDIQVENNWKIKFTELKGVYNEVGQLDSSYSIPCLTAE